jgi:hypothetical protein
VPSKYFALISFTTGLSCENAKIEKIKQINKQINFFIFLIIYLEKNKINRLTRKQLYSIVNYYVR